MSPSVTWIFKQAAYQLSGKYYILLIVIKQEQNAQLQYLVILMLMFKVEEVVGEAGLNLLINNAGLLPLNRDLTETDVTESPSNNACSVKQVEN